MIPKDLIADLPFPPGHQREALLYTRILLRYLADHVYTSTLANGERISDAMNARRWFEEMAAEASLDIFERGDAEILRCPLCNHIHENRNECGVYLSELRFCKCTHQLEATLR